MNIVELLLNKKNQLGVLITVLVVLILGVGLTSPVSTNSSSSNSSQSASTGTTSATSSSTSSSTNNAPATVTMTFDSMGGSSVNPITITNGVQNTAPEVPTRDFSNFQGWFYEETYIRQVNFQFDFVSTPALEDLTVYAKWLTQSSTIRFVYLDTNNQEVNASTQFVPMLSCIDDFGDDKYGIMIPTRPTSQNVNQFTYLDWDLTVLPECLDDASFYNIKIFAPREFKEYTRTLAQSFNINQVKDIELSSGISSVVLSSDSKVYSMGSNGVFKMPSLTGTIDNSAIGVFDITSRIPLQENEVVIDLISMYQADGSDFVVRPGMLFLTNQSRILDFNNVTVHDTGNGFVDITSKLSLANDETIVDIVSGSNYFVTLTSANRIVGLGNLPSYPGTNFTSPTVVNTTSVFGSDTIVDMSSGYRSVALRTNTGKAAVFGANQSGQIGLDSSFSNSPIRLLSNYTNVSLIEATHDRIYMVADQGTSIQKVFASGYYIYDSLGGNAFQVGFIELTKFDSANDYYQPLAAGETLVQIAGMPLDTLFMTSAGRILTVGPNMQRVTLGSDISNTSNPELLNATTLRDTTSYLGTFDAQNNRLLTFKGVSNSEAVFYVLNVNGAIKGSGQNRYGLLGSSIGSNGLSNGFITPNFTGWRILLQDTIAYGTGFSVPDPTPVPGFTFLGWSLSENGPIHLQPGGIVGINMPSYNLILYARYQADSI